MKKLFALVKRNLKEIVRDPLSAVFCVAFPVVMLVLLEVIFKNFEYVPDNFKIENYSVGICVFGYSFVMLFVAMMIATDKNTEFINRINASPVKKSTYLLSFVLATMPIALAQTLLFFIVAMLFGLKPSVDILVATVYLLPSAIFFVSLGVLFGTIAKNEKASSPLCSIIISISGMLGGVFMPVEDMGTFSKINGFLPFTHAVKIASGAFLNNYACFLDNILWVALYTLAVWIIISLINVLKANKK